MSKNLGDEYRQKLLDRAKNLLQMHLKLHQRD